MNNERIARIEIIKVCKRLYEKGFVTACDGNVSIKIDDSRFLMTPSGFCKGDLKEEDLIICDENGNKLSGKHNVTSEAPMHLEAYKQRSDIKAIVHAHPATATALSLAGVEITEDALPEVILSLGKIPTAEYATPTTIEGAMVIRDLVKYHDAIILDRHGSITIGTDVWSAYYKLEKVEHAAKIVAEAKKLGGVKTLTEEELVAVQRLSGGNHQNSDAELTDLISKLVSKELKRIL